MTIALFTLAQALDAMSTYYTITYLGAREIMPAANWLIAQGWDTFLVAKLLFSVVFIPIYAFYRHSFDAETARWLFALTVGLAFFPVINNIAQIVWSSTGG